ncbi:MAG: zinc transporter ZntB [Paracoccaceae bacterium]
MELITSFAMGLDGTVSELDPEDRSLAELAAEAPDGGFVWCHVDLAIDGADAWLRGAPLDSVILDALTAAETRPRCTLHGDGALLNLRGVNLNPGAEPEDMVSLRLWVTGRLVVSAQLRQLKALLDVVDAARRGQGPDSPAELIARLALRMADRAEPVVAGLNERIDDLEEAVLQDAGGVHRGALADMRRVAIVLRRYLAPQRDALSTLEIEDLSWIRSHDRSRLREATERMTRLAEELDAIRDRAQVVQDQILEMRSEAMNRQMLVLSVVAAVFLPLGLITGLLGINVGGIPGTDTPWAFWAVCALLVAVVGFQLWLFKKMGLIGKG